MRNIVAAVCAIALLPVGVYVQAPDEPRPSPLSRSIASAIAQLQYLPPADPRTSGLERDAVTGTALGSTTGISSMAPHLVARQEPNRVSDWSRVRELQRGTEITLTVTGSPTATVVLLVANDLAVFVLKPTGPELPGHVNVALIGIGDQWPSIFNGGANYSETNGVRAAQDGIFDGNRKVADLAQVVQRVPREHVSELRAPGKRKGNKLLAGIGAGGGFLLGSFIGIGLAFKDCGSSCSDEKFLIGLSVIGLPIALGVLGYYGGSHTVGGIIYRAPASATDELRNREVAVHEPVSGRILQAKSVLR